MKVLSVAAEAFPLIKTGGLADVVGALPEALGRLGVDMRVMLPLYRSLGERDALVAAARPVLAIDDLFGGPARVLEAEADFAKLFLLDAPHHFDRPGNPYLHPHGYDWPDNHLRFAALGFAGHLLALDGADGWLPDIVHPHDWHAGLTSAYLAFSGRVAPPSVLTVHNLAFQGNFPARFLSTLRLPTAAFTQEVAEFYGQISFLKAGVTTADRITTVSPTYAEEITRPDLGMGFDGVLRSRGAHLSGILNGIDDALWDPAADPALPAPFAARSLAGKARNKAALQERFGLAVDPSRLVFCVVSRMTHQKGIDLIVACLPDIIARGGQLVALGSGEPGLEAALRDAANAHPRSVGVVIGYDEPLAHRIQAGADAILVPSRFEPCGLTQLIGLRYGTLPIVARTGGLADTVVDANPMAIRRNVATGFQFAPGSAADLSAALDRAFRLFADSQGWTATVTRAMSEDVSWNVAARDYHALYRTLTRTAA